jgi:UDP-4-amino-4,6-dideoxy-N-acetyl-beta-L-altrosamine transaminase
MIPYGRQNISNEDISSVVEVLQSDFLTQGPQTPRFEGLVAMEVGARHGVAMNSATSALHVACLALDVGPGDLVWTSPITFVASANCARYCGADIDFVDIDRSTFNISPDSLEKKLLQASNNGRLPKVIVAVHMCGQSPDMARIARLAGEYGIKIIEDASHSIGADYLDKPVGSCIFSDITIFSFHPVKIITTAEGGMALTNDSQLATRMNRFRSHGITRDESEMTRPSHGPWYYQQIELGYNYRMTDIQAALGISQMGKLKEFVTTRRFLAERYDAAFSGLPLEVPGRLAGASSSWHLYVIQLQDPSTHLNFFESLRSSSIGVNVHYIPVHLQPYYQNLGFAAGDFPYAEDYYSRAISLPLYPGLTIAEQDYVIATVKNAIKN